MVKRLVVKREGADMLTLATTSQAKTVRKYKLQTPVQFRVASNEDVKRAIIKSNRKHSEMMRKLSR